MLHWISATSIAKLGQVPVSYSSKDTCPKDCRFYPKEDGKQTPCFAWANFRIRQTIKKAEKKMPTSFEDAMQKSYRFANIVRHFVSGDVVGQESEILRICQEVSEYYKLINIGYTHTWKRSSSIPFKKYFRASCETLEDVNTATNNGWATVLVVTDFTEQVKKKISDAGLIPFPCPEQVHGRVQCNTCKACKTETRADYHRVVLFKSHKNKNAVNDVIEF